MATKKKSKADDYKGSGMSKGAYEKAEKAKKEAADKAKKAAEAKAAAKKSTAKKTETKSEKKSASSSFNYKAVGISTDAWNKLGSSGQAAMAVIGAGVMKTIDKNKPLPTVLDDKEMNELWKEAESDPIIQKYYAEEMAVAKDYLNKNIDLVSAEFKSLTETQQRDYIDAKKALDEASGATGIAYSGFRKQASDKADTQQSGIVESTRRTLQSQLNQVGQQFEQRFGSAALVGTKLGTPVVAGSIGNYNNTTYTGASYNPVDYDPTGGITGTQASDILSSKLTKQQDLAAEKLQEISLENIQREKNTMKALNKLN
jgi:hypothetical protein